MPMLISAFLSETSNVRWNELFKCERVFSNTVDVARMILLHIDVDF
jgi:hypothetical protein